MIYSVIIAIAIITIAVLAPAYAYAVHDDIWTTIEVSIINANVSRTYELSVGIPKAHSSLSVSQDYIMGEETQYYNYEFEFEDIPAGTPFEVCVQEEGDYWSPTYLEKLCTRLTSVSELLYLLLA